MAPNLQIPYRGELLDLQRRHSVVSLTNAVTRRQIHDEADRGKPFDVVHILVDDEIAFDEAGRARLVIRLPDGDALDTDAINHILQRAGNAGFWINSCFGAYFAADAVYRGNVPWAIGNTLRINIKDAWVGPQAWYGAMADMEKPDPWEAFGYMPKDAGYAYFINPAKLKVDTLKPLLGQLDLVKDQSDEAIKTMRHMQTQMAILETRVSVERPARQFTFMEFIIAVIVVGISVLLSVFALGYIF